MNLARSRTGLTHVANRLTYPSQSENGSPWSLANAKSWREVVILLLIKHSKSRAQTTATMTEVPAVDPVALNSTCIHGRPNDVLNIAETSLPSDDMTVIVMMKPTV